MTGDYLELRYFSEPATDQGLEQMLATPGASTTDSFEQYIEFVPIREILDDLLQGTGKNVAGWDAELAPTVHAALHHLDRRLLLDMRLWHWLAIEPFSKFVLRRWCGVNDIGERTEPLTAAQRGHFLGRQTLNGVNRNAIARLYWTADALYTPEDKYELLNSVMSRQDLLTGVFERLIGLYPPAARACVNVLKDRSEDERRERLRYLQLVAGTVVLESLEQSDIEEILLSAA